MNRTAIACQLLGISLLAGCATPDLQLARQAKDSGDLATAEANFQPLAEQGFIDAQIGWADVLVRSPQPDRQAKGEALYRDAIGRSPLAPVRLGKWLASKPVITVQERAEAVRLLSQGLAEGDTSALLPWVRVQLQDPQAVQGNELERQLDQFQAQGIGEAQLGKILLYRTRGDYDQHIAEIESTCSRWLSQVSECYVELAGIYQLQGASDKQEQLLERLQADYKSGLLPPERVQAVAKVLADNSVGEPNPQAAKNLYLAITPVLPDAWCGLTELVMRYPDEGEADEVRDYLQKGIDAGSTRASLLLGQIYLKGQVLPADPQAAEKYLLMAAPSQNRAHFFLGKLYSDGQLGNMDARKARDHLLIAARGGDAAADVALAQLFGDGRGVKINRVYAYSFARLAQQRGLAQGQILVERLGAQMQPDELSQAQDLLMREVNARGGQQISSTITAEQAQGVL
ncbi:alginate biosynthesis protein AlgK [Pseudomonas sp. LRF_L74]|uniref:alginate biosynthesis protein AlgK n=1 Tax=Pseudomonas sp. LRF_L74 TaxID=3369422 RepID=UPI003F5FBE15